MSTPPQLTRLTNCRLVVGDRLETRDLWVSRRTGRIEDGQQAFFSGGGSSSSGGAGGSEGVAAEVVDLGGRIVAPGLIDVQINGSFGFDFSTPSPLYADQLRAMNRQLVRTGVTSYLPTLPSQTQDVYHQTLHHLGQPTTREGRDGAESLGAHCEGPFINVEKHGIHRPAVIRRPEGGLAALQAMYGARMLQLDPERPGAQVRCVTLAPEEAGNEAQAAQLIRQLRARGIVVSVGHSAASDAQMRSAARAGATMITHLFNAMSSPHHRDTGIFGMLGREDDGPRPFFGIIADNIHVAPNMVRVAYNAHPLGCILVTDAMAMVGMPDGEYADFPWTNGATVVKKGIHLTLKGIPGSIAGSAVTLIECLNNLLQWTRLPIATALQTVTSTPARMLGVEKTKGALHVGADADLVVFDEVPEAWGTSLHVAQVWKFGERVYEDSGFSATKPVQARL